MNFETYNKAQNLPPNNMDIKLKTEPGKEMETDEGIAYDYSHHDVGYSTSNLVKKMVRETECFSRAKSNRGSFSDSGYSSGSSATPSPEPRNIIESRYMVAKNLDAESPSSPPIYHDNHHDNHHDIHHDNQQKVKKPEKECHVCGEVAHGNFFGAVVCLPCKTFFIRCTTEDASTFICRQSDGNCDVTGINRSRCKYCRYKKCLQHGMTRKERPEHVVIQEGQQLCKVCGDVANGVHFGVMSCEGCKKFFRRGLRESDSYLCKVGGKCIINPRTRNDCRFCRFEKCLRVGMSTSAIRMGRPKKAAQEVVGKKRPIAENENGDMRHSPEIKPFAEGLHHSYMYPHFMQQYHHGMQNSLQNNTNHIIKPPISPSVMKRYEGSSPIFNPRDFAKHSVMHPEINYQAQNGDMSPPIKRPKIQQERAYSLSPNSSSHIPNVRDINNISDVSNDHFSSEIKLNKHIDNNHKDCVIIKEEIIDLDYEESSKGDHHHPASSAADILPPHSSMCDTDSNREQFLAHKYDGSYWNVLSHQYRDMSPMCESQNKLVNNLAVAYLELIETFCKAPLAQDSDTENDITQKRFIHYISAVINFMRTIPGFTQMFDEDKYTILRLGAIQVCAVVASIHLYNPVQNCFIKSFFEENLDANHPAHHFQKALLSFARRVHSLNLDNMEAAFLCALLTLATDWPNLQKVDQIEKIQNELLCTLKSYISMKYGEKTERMQSMFSIIPTLRKLGMWHYKISYESCLT